MNNKIDKLLDKVGKKQIVTVMGIVALWNIPAPVLVQAVCITLIVMYNNTCQTFLDNGGKLLEKEKPNGSLIDPANL